jgi:hypothetical protein
MVNSIPSDTEQFATQEIPAQYTNNQVRQAVQENIRNTSLLRDT